MGRDPYRIAVIVGSLRRESINRRLSEALIRLAPPDLALQRVGIGDLPLYNQDDDERQAAPVLRFKGEIEASEGLIFVTPEYNRSIPGVLKNAIDHGSRPYGKSLWGGRPAGVIGATFGMIGTAAAQQHLRNILACLNVRTMGQPEAFIRITDDFFDPEGNAGPESREFLQKWMKRFAAWVRLHAD